MKFQNPLPTTERETLKRIADATSDSDSDSEIIDAVLAAVFHCETRFAGDVLLDAFSIVEGANRLYLGNITNSFLQMHETNYLVGSFVEEMKKAGPDPLAMADNIEGAVELGQIFSNCPKSNLDCE